jgi:hypothetical protein
MDRYQMHKYRHGKRGRCSVCMRCGAKRRNRGRVVNGKVTPKWQYMAQGFAQWVTTNPPCAERSA